MWLPAVASWDAASQAAASRAAVHINAAVLTSACWDPDEEAAAATALAASCAPQSTHAAAPQDAASRAATSWDPEEEAAAATGVTGGVSSVVSALAAMIHPPLGLLFQ